ncbi:MAG: hypothetical protein ACI9UA_006156 [Pseudoalteromonas tetraodonis]|jgi:hypothetical protein
MPNYAISPVNLEAELRALPIAYDVMASPAMSAADAGRSEELYFLAMEGDQSAIPGLKRLIKKYPEIPALKNHLSVVYRRNGQRGLMNEVNDQLRRENPGYLFGLVNHAANFTTEGQDWMRVPEFFGESLQLAALKPDVECFHFTQVRA